MWTYTTSAGAKGFRGPRFHEDIRTVVTGWSRRGLHFRPHWYPEWLQEAVFVSFDLDRHVPGEVEYTWCSLHSVSMSNLMNPATVNCRWSCLRRQAPSPSFVPVGDYDAVKLEHVGCAYIPVSDAKDLGRLRYIYIIHVFHIKIVHLYVSRTHAYITVTLQFHPRAVPCREHARHRAFSNSLQEPCSGQETHHGIYTEPLLAPGNLLVKQVHTN